MEDRYVSSFVKSGRVLVARIKPGSDLLNSIRCLAEQNQVKAGVILSGVGLLRKAHLRNCKALPKEYPITDANRLFLALERPLEILSLSGNFCEVEGQPSIHAHVTLSYVEGEEVRVVGGHLLEGCIVCGFVEVFIAEIEGVKITREFDEETRTLQLSVAKRR